MSNDDGGPAFPNTMENWANGFGGISLRDYFAAKALEALIEQAGPPAVDKSCRKDFASMAYDYANAMLAERKREKP